MRLFFLTGACLARANRSGKRKVRLQAAIDLNCGIAGAEDALAFRPFGQRLGETAGKFAERMQAVIIHAHNAEPAKPWTQIRGKIVQLCEHGKMLGGEFSVVDVRGLKNSL